MRHWGVIVTAYYVAILAVLLLPGGSFIAFRDDTDDLLLAYDHFLALQFSVEGTVEAGWFAWLTVAVFAVSQALLLFLSVDTSFERLRARRRVALSVTTMTFASGMLLLAVIWSISVAIWSDDAGEELWLIIGAPLFSWGFWGVIFYLYRERISARLDRAVSWLLGGSVLQLLVVVPCHVIVRNRDDCCAPFVTGYGIATGIAVMLMAFGPSVLFLYQKRLRQYGLDTAADLARPRRVVSLALGTVAAGSLALAALLPSNDYWSTYWRFSPEISDEFSFEAISAAVNEAASFNIESQMQHSSEALLFCNSERIGRIGATSWRYGDNRFGQWSITLRVDQAELLDALVDTMARYTSVSSTTVPPAAINQWRARLSYSTLFGRGCEPQ